MVKHRSKQLGEERVYFILNGQVYQWEKLGAVTETETTEECCFLDLVQLPFFRLLIRGLFHLTPCFWSVLYCSNREQTETPSLSLTKCSRVFCTGLKCQPLSSHPSSLPSSGSFNTSTSYLNVCHLQYPDCLWLSSILYLFSWLWLTVVLHTSLTV